MSRDVRASFHDSLCPCLQDSEDRAPDRALTEGELPDGSNPENHSTSCATRAVEYLPDRGITKHKRPVNFCSRSQVRSSSMNPCSVCPVADYRFGKMKPQGRD